MDGTAALMSCTVLAGEADVRAAFEAARNDEYEEIVDRCDDFLVQVKKEYLADHFTFAELEENEVDLVKLRNWFARIRQRDAFGAAGRRRRRRRRWTPASRRSMTMRPGCTRSNPTAARARAPARCRGPVAASLVVNDRHFLV